MKEVSLAATEGQTPQPTPPRGGRINLFGGPGGGDFSSSAPSLSAAWAAPWTPSPPCTPWPPGQSPWDSAAPEVAGLRRRGLEPVLVNRDSPLPTVIRWS